MHNAAVNLTGTVSNAAGSVGARHRTLSVSRSTVAISNISQTRISPAAAPTISLLRQRYRLGSGHQERQPGPERSGGESGCSAKRFRDISVLDNRVVMRW